MLKELIDAIMRVFFGHNAVDNAADWKKSHNKAVKSRREVKDIISDHANRK